MVMIKSETMCMLVNIKKIIDTLGYMQFVTYLGKTLIFFKSTGPK